MNCELVERDLDAYIDRELDVEAVASVRDHVNDCQICRHRVAEREAIGRLVRSVPYYSAPDRLRGRVVQTARPSPVRHILPWAAAAVLAISIGTTVTWIRTTVNPADALAAEVVSEHVRSLMAAHLFDVRSTDQHTVKPWFLGKLDFSPPVADLAAGGFPLVGGRLDYLEGRAVAALVYQRRQHIINVFVSPAADDPASRTVTRSDRGFQVHHWVSAGMSFWAVSDLNDGELSEFVHALQSPQ
jgi:anti-sigma factor RsiW